MIFRLMLFLLVFQSASVCSQVSDSEMNLLKANWRKELSETGRELALKSERKEGLSDFSDSIRRIFLQDTFVVENLYRRQLEKESTTLGINKANLACSSEYEQLIDTYYGMLLARMKEEDKSLLVSWQGDWKSLLIKERELVGLLMQEQYSGGGSIHSIRYTHRLKQQQRDHLLLLLDYLIYII